jgi:Uncharacterised nucleotidyltransferase
VPDTSSIITNNRENEWAVLVECASPQRSAPHLLSERLQGSFDWRELLIRADQHGVLGLLAEQLKILNPPPQAEIREAVREWQRRQTLLTLSLTAEMFRLLEHLAALGIEVLVTKGPVLSVRCYGDPGMRQYGDVDLIVRDKDIHRSTEAMIALGYTPKVPVVAIQAKKSPGEYVFRSLNAQVLIEFHTERTFRYHPRRLQIENLFQRHAFVAIDGRDVPALSLEDELVLICVHGAKHCWERLMWIADVAALISRTHAPDWDRVVAVAREVGAERILRLGLRLTSDMLGADLPVHLEPGIRSDRAVSKLAAQITSRLASPEPRDIGILQRAAFRLRMRDGLLPGAAYLFRLLLSPTEEDWTPGKEGSRSAFVDAVSRPFRLARKHSRRSNN